MQYESAYEHNKGRDYSISMQIASLTTQITTISQMLAAVK